MPENLFLSPCLLADCRTFTWINERPHLLKPHSSNPADPSIHTSDYRRHFLPIYAGRKTRLQHPLAPFTGATSSLKVYKSTGVHPSPPLEPKDPELKERPRVPLVSSADDDPKTFLTRLYMQSEYRVKFTSFFDKK